MSILTRVQDQLAKQGLKVGVIQPPQQPPLSVAEIPKLPQISVSETKSAFAPISVTEAPEQPELNVTGTLPERPLTLTEKIDTALKNFVTKGKEITGKVEQSPVGQFLSTFIPVEEAKKRGFYNDESLAFLKKTGGIIKDSEGKDRVLDPYSLFGVGEMRNVAQKAITSAAKQIAKLTKADEIFPLVKELVGGEDTAIQKTAEELANIAKPRQVEQILNRELAVIGTKKTAIQEAEQAVAKINEKWIGGELAETQRFAEQKLVVGKIAKKYNIPYQDLENEVFWLPKKLPPEEIVSTPMTQKELDTFFAKEKKTVKPTIPPELQPLAQEARKYKSAEEFVRETTRQQKSIVENLIKKSDEAFAKSNEITGGKGAVENARNIKIGQELKDKAIKEERKLLNKLSASQLTDIWNQATKAVKEPIISAEPIKLYHGSNKTLTKQELDYGTFLTANKQEAVDYANMRSGGRGGKPIISEFTFNPNEVKLNTGTGEYQYIGKTKNLAGGKYPEIIYKALNDAEGSNLTRKEIDAIPFDELRTRTSMGLEGGRDEFDKLIGKTKAVKELPEAAEKFVSELPPEVPQETKETAGTVIDRLTQALKSAKPVREETEALYSAERGRRIRQAEAIGQNVGGEKGFFAQLSKLKGELPKAQFESVRSQFAQSEIDSLFDTVQQANILPFEKITAKGALAKLFEGTVPTRNEIDLLSDIFPKDFIDAILSNRSRAEKIFDYLGQIANVPRTLMASVDFSAPLRQGLFLIGRPKQFLPDFTKMFKYAFSEKAYQGAMEAIKSRATYQNMREAKLALTEIGGSLGRKEEAFMGNIVEKIPGLGHLVKASNQAYTGFLNQLRADVFDDLLKKAGDLGIKQDERFLKSLGEYINAATGRGSFGLSKTFILPKTAERAATILNATFFSPRLMASRLNLLNPYFYIQLNPFVRKQALRDLLVLGSVAGTTLGLASLSDDVEIGANPNSADFGKIKVGNTRYDIFGGFQQYIRLASQLISGKIVSSTTGRTMTIGEGFGMPTRKDIALRFFENKTAPIPSFLIQWLQGESAIGEDFDVPAEITDRLIPMFVQDLYDISQEKGTDKIWEGLPAMFGIGAQTYGKQELVTGQNPIGEETMQIRPVRALAERLRETVLGQRPLGTSTGASVEAYYDQLSELPKEQAAEVFDQIIKGNPELAKKINQVVKEREKGITPENKDLKAKGVASGDRAIAVKKELDNLETNEEKKKLWDEYVNKGIITKEVARQLMILLNK